MTSKECTNPDGSRVLRPNGKPMTYVDGTRIINADGTELTLLDGSKYYHEDDEIPHGSHFRADGEPDPSEFYNYARDPNDPLKVDITRGK